MSSNSVLKLVEMRLAIMQHCRAMKAIITFLEQGNVTAAIARLDQATKALDAALRGTEVGEILPCFKCGHEQAVLAWVDNKVCERCGAEIPL
jgi:hypothetical protein